MKMKMVGALEIYVFAVCLFAPVVGSCAASEGYNIRVVSDGKGSSSGSGGYVHVGELIVDDNGFALVIKSVEDRMAPGAKKAVNPRPFRARAFFLEKGVVKLSLDMPEVGRDTRTLGNAYNLVYLVAKNVIYPFWDKEWKSRNTAKDDEGRIVLAAIEPEEVQLYHFGSISGKEYRLGPVSPDAFYVISDQKGDREDIRIESVSTDGSNTDIHVREIPARWRFPKKTRMITFYGRLDPSRSKEENIEMFLGDQPRLESYTRVDILLDKMTPAEVEEYKIKNRMGLYKFLTPEQRAAIEQAKDEEDDVQEMILPAKKDNGR